MDINPEWISAVAAVLTTYAFVPQAIKVIRDKDTHAISKQMYIIFCTGLVLWLTYGLMMGSIPIIIGNAVTLTLALIILVMKLRLG